MPDISMCPGIDKNGVECPKRKSCYRYKASPVLQHQSWVVPPVGIENMKNCQYYWDEKANNYINQTKVKT